MSTIPAPPAAGDAYVLAEEDYAYGVGPVLARIVTVFGRIEYLGEPWWYVEADVAQGDPKAHSGWHRRELNIREASFPRTLRRPEW
jgi:hypothetical protein